MHPETARSVKSEYLPPVGLDPVAQSLIGQSRAMQQLRETIRQVAPAGIPVLIVGPTGAGKELVARALHRFGRRSGELVAFNVCAVSDGMFESTLFGHVKGAFTGAIGDAPGYLAEANGGSLFLDEISGLTLASQAKLLRALESGTYRPVGARRDRESRFRLVSATNEELAARVATGAFRSDLYHRLSGFVLRVPPLTARLEDVELLVRHFLNGAGLSSVRLGSGVADVLVDHDWPGNVRELRHTVERMALTVGIGGVITRDAAASAILRVNAREDEVGSVAIPSLSRARLIQALEACAWDVERVSERHGVHRATVYRWMRREGISPRTGPGWL